MIAPANKPQQKAATACQKYTDLRSKHTMSFQKLERMIAKGEKNNKFISIAVKWKQSEWWKQKA